MTDQELADTLIERLNTLIEDPVVRHELGVIINFRFACNERLLEHPTIQVVQSAPDAPPTVGFLGILNGIVGVIPEGQRKAWGWIAAEFDDNNNLVRFLRTA